MLCWWLHIHDKYHIHVSNWCHATSSAYGLHQVAVLNVKGKVTMKVCGLCCSFCQRIAEGLAPGTSTGCVWKPSNKDALMLTAAFYNLYRYRRTDRMVCLCSPKAAKWSDLSFVSCLADRRGPFPVSVRGHDLLRLCWWNGAHLQSRWPALCVHAAAAPPSRL